jgi:hypothetical protein
MSTRKVQRRPEGIRWECDTNFLQKLNELLDSGVSAAEVAHEVGKAMGYEIDDSMIRKLRSGRVPSSVLIGPMCRVYGWPVPRLAGASPRLGRFAARVYELEKLDPGSVERIERLVDALYDAQTIERDSLPKKPGPEKKSG